MKISKSPRAKGFTLMEMLLVLGIIALLVGMGTYMMVNVLGDAEEGKVKGDIQSLHASLIRYKTKGGLYPTTSQGLKALVSKPIDGPQPRSYKTLLREQALFDPWGNPYQYRRPGKYNADTYDVFSMGPDGKEGTEDDIGNW
jgi:general secretion pathway protein G